MAGLSPLTRGNLDRWTGHTPPPGPIPAHAGEPLHGTLQLTTAWAYPRSRGGTRPGPTGCIPLPGLSPLTRGNLTQRIAREKSIGPIPAHAGEPGSHNFNQSMARAYPRSRGGTSSCSCVGTVGGGLSPLTRGNRVCQADACAGDGPIPAHAGEPCSSWLLLPQVGAYPRSRGGTIPPGGSPVGE